MIKITVDTVDELNIVRRILHTEACANRTCPNLGKRDTSLCAKCIDVYCENRVKLYKNEIVEVPEKVVV